MPELEKSREDAEKFAGSEGGPKAPNHNMPKGATDDSKMENEHEMRRENAVSTDSADQVAGRKGKGTMTGLLEKMTGHPDDKTTGSGKAEQKMMGGDAEANLKQ